MVLPTASEGPLIWTRKRLSESPYSLTSSLRDLPDFFLSPAFSFGVRNILVSGIRTRIPTARVIRPTGRKVKNEISFTEASTRPFILAVLRVSWMIRLGGVPISVIMPPMLPAKARGIRSLREDVPECEAILTTIGSIRAIVPVLLTKLPIRAVTSITRRKSLVWLVPASLIT